MLVKNFATKIYFSRRLFIFMSIFFSILLLSSSSQAGNEKTVALVMKALSNPFFFKMEEGASSYANNHGIPLEVFGVERETDVKRQISIVENLISRGYGAIVIAPVDSKKLVPVCKKALAKGIIVINIDNPLHKETLEEEGISIPFVGSDNYIGASMVGEYIKAKIKGRGRVIVVEGIPGVENAELRKKGFIDTVIKDSKIEIVRSESANWHTDEAFSLASALLQQHKSIDAIFCANDKMALGVLQALELMELTGKILVAGYDNIESVRNEMRNNRIHATVEQHPELMGEYGVRLAWQALNGQQSPPLTKTPLDLITYESFNKKIALSVSSLDNSFFQFLLEGAQKTAELHGAEFKFADAKNDQAKQLIDLSNFINEKVNLIIINPTNTEMISPGIEMANKNRIPVITVDRKSTGGDILCHVASDNIEGGKMAARELAKHLKSKGNVIEIEGIPGTSAAHDRGAGFNKELRNYPGIHVVAREAANFDRQAAEQVMTHIIKDDQLKFDAVFAHNDNMILGVMDALERKKLKSQPLLIGFDALPEAVKAIKQGKLTATIAQQPNAMGRLSVTAAIRYLRGEKLSPVMHVELSLISQ